MAQQILTASEITFQSLDVLRNNTTFSRMANKGYDAEFGKQSHQIGDTLNIRKPARYVGRTGQAIEIEDQTETSVPLQLSNLFGVDLAFTQKDLTLSLANFSKRVIEPAVVSIANRIDQAGLILAKNSVGNMVGTPGTPVSAYLTYLTAGARMSQEACPKDKNRHIVMDPIAEATIVDSLKGLFQKSDDIAKQYATGNMGTSGGFEWSMDQNIITHTVGALGGTPTVSSTANQSGSSITTSGWTANVTGVLKRGDIFTIAGVYAVNPQSRLTTNALRQFSVQSDVNSDGSGNATITILPSIIGPVSPTLAAQYQNVTSLPAANASITVSGTAGMLTVCNLAYHMNAFTLGCADLELPRGVDMAARASDEESGLTLSMVRAYDITMGRTITRIECLSGWAALYPELACQIRG